MKKEDLIELIHSEMDVRIRLLYERIHELQIELDSEKERREILEQFFIKDFTQGQIADIDRRVREGFTSGIDILDKHGKLIGMVHHGRFTWQCKPIDIARIVHALRADFGMKENAHAQAARFAMQYLPDSFPKDVQSEQYKQYLDTLKDYLKKLYSGTLEEDKKTKMHLGSAAENVKLHILRDKEVTASKNGDKTGVVVKRKQK